jgi:uncharacterized membrane-anchored protein YitT (DUF2179 family)
MNSFFRKHILKIIAQSSKNQSVEARSSYDVAKEFYRWRLSALHFLKGAFLIIVGVVSAGFGLKGFLLPNSFIDGGVTGISLLTAELTNYPLPILIVCINIPFVIVGYSQLGKVFAIKSIVAITGLALAITFINYPVITSD